MAACKGGGGGVMNPFMEAVIILGVVWVLGGGLSFLEETVPKLIFW